ncbi:hypothetical protein [Nitrosopumilus sp. b3]|uniref:hypothetical protein n=1 Tax=Nitrosopumilus sp. b3 TaxID=2109909 RepID=UPI0015F4FB83|nr:hypothetical protein [Nitrosopumilus sp. b3]
MELKERVAKNKTRIIITIIVVVCGSVATSIISVVTGVDILQIGIILVTIILSGIVTILGILWGKDIIHRIIPISHEIHSTSNFPIDHEYFEKLQRDILEPIKNEYKKSNDLFHSIYNLGESDRISILAHLYTAEKKSEQFRGLFSEYYETQKKFRRINIKESGFLYELTQFSGHVKSVTYDKNFNTLHNAWFDEEKFKIAIRFPQELLHYPHDTLKMKNYIESFYDFDTPSVRHQDGKENLILHNIVMGGSDSYELTCKMWEKYNEEIRKLKLIKDEVVEAYFWYPRQKTSFEGIALLPILNDIDNGKIRMGVCRRCLEYFQGSEYDEWKLLLEKFYKEFSDKV